MNRLGESGDDVSWIFGVGLVDCWAPADSNSGLSGRLLRDGYALRGDPATARYLGPCRCRTGRKCFGYNTFGEQWVRAGGCGVEHVPKP
ncbi:Uncharacterised protein [Nocardia brasiliensis]|nr:Uncharacterised protein [Nocardia brasiliensis]